MTIRVHAYIDGLNLYHSTLKQEPALRQCNVKQLVKLFLQSNDELKCVTYYSAFPKHLGGAKQNAFSNYEAALKRSNVEVVLGEFKKKITNLNQEKINPSLPISLEGKKYGYISHEEKETDVNIAIDMVSDAYNDQYDKAILISGDSDLVPAIKRVLEEFPNKGITVMAPPTQHARIQPIAKVRYLQEKYNKQLRTVKINIDHIRECQFY